MSKELEAFRDILGILCAVSGCEIDMNSERIKIVKQALLKAQKEHRALEILHNKINIELNYFDKSLYVGDYASELSEEEFNLLKEVL